MEDSILKTIRHMIGGVDDCHDFDSDLIIHINTILSILAQVGIGPASGFMITGESETWTDFLGGDARLSAVKSYIYLKVKLLFDSSSMSSGLMDSIKQQISEIEWRMNIAAET